jgi:hypothetical protein
MCVSRFNASHSEAAAALVEIVRLAAGEFLMRERSDVARFNQNNVIRILHFAFDEQKCFFSD